MAVIQFGIALSSLLAALMQDDDAPPAPRELERASLYAMLQSLPTFRRSAYVMRRDTQPYIGMTGVQKANWAMGRLVCPHGHRGEFTIFSLAVEQALTFSNLHIEGDDSSHPGVRVAAAVYHSGDSWRTLEEPVRLFYCLHDSHKEPSDVTQGYFMLPRKLVNQLEWMDDTELEEMSKEHR